MTAYAILLCYCVACVLDAVYQSGYSRAMVRIVAVAMCAYILSVCVVC